jgi:hypothetical protein
VRVVELTEELWSASKEQAGRRALHVVRSLIEAGFLPDGAVRRGIPCIAKELEPTD